MTAKPSSKRQADTRVAPTLHVPSPKKFTATWSAPSSCSTSCSGAYKFLILLKLFKLLIQVVSYGLAAACTGSSALHDDLEQQVLRYPFCRSMQRQVSNICTEWCYEELFAFFL